MSESELQPSPAQYRSIPTLIPSFCFLSSFAIISLLHLYKYIKLRRKIYLYLFIFGSLRICLFTIRIAWSANPDSFGLGIISNVLLVGGFFVIIEALCILLSDWIHLLTAKLSISLPKHEKNSIEILKLLLPLFSIIGAIGEIFGQSENHYDISLKLRQTSSLGFLCLICIYVLLVAYFASKYGEGAIRKQLKALVLFISASLLLIELVYRTFVSFSETSPIFYYEWVFFVFECVPEIALLIILGKVILGEWFYDIDNGNRLTPPEGPRSKENFCVKVLVKNNGVESTEKREEKSEVVIKMNDDSKLSKNSV